MSIEICHGPNLEWMNIGRTNEPSFQENTHLTHSYSFLQLGSFTESFVTVEKNDVKGKMSRKIFLPIICLAGTRKILDNLTIMPWVLYM